MSNVSQQCDVILPKRAWVKILTNTHVPRYDETMRGPLPDIRGLSTGSHTIRFSSCFFVFSHVFSMVFKHLFDHVT